MTAPTQHPTSALLRAKEARSYIAAHPGCSAGAVYVAVPELSIDGLLFLEKRGYITTKQRGDERRYWVRELGVES